jgi:hypothetical protein
MIKNNKKSLDTQKNPKEYIYKPKKGVIPPKLTRQTHGSGDEIEITL